MSDDGYYGRPSSKVFPLFAFLIGIVPFQWELGNVDMFIPNGLFSLIAPVYTVGLGRFSRKLPSLKVFAPTMIPVFWVSATEALLPYSYFLCALPLLIQKTSGS